MLTRSIIRTVAVRRTALASAPRRGLSTTTLRASAVKPGSESEATTPGSGSTEDIANSEGAYDGSRTNPHSSTNKIEHETQANFNSSSANAETSEYAAKTEHQSDRRPSKQQQNKPDRSDFGATEARKQGGRGGQGA